MLQEITSAQYCILKIIYLNNNKIYNNKNLDTYYLKYIIKLQINIFT